MGLLCIFHFVFRKRHEVLKSHGSLPLEFAGIDVVIQQSDILLRVLSDVRYDQPGVVWDASPQKPVELVMRVRWTHISYLDGQYLGEADYPRDLSEGSS